MDETKGQAETNPPKRTRTLVNSHDRQSHDLTSDVKISRHSKIIRRTCTIPGSFCSGTQRLPTILQLTLGSRVSQRRVTSLTEKGRPKARLVEVNLTNSHGNNTFISHPCIPSATTHKPSKAHNDVQRSHSLAHR